MSSTHFWLFFSSIFRSLQWLYTSALFTLNKGLNYPGEKTYQAAYFTPSRVIYTGLTGQKGSRSQPFLLIWSQIHIRACQYIDGCHTKASHSDSPLPRQVSASEFMINQGQTKVWGFEVEPPWSILIIINKLEQPHHTTRLECNKIKSKIPFYKQRTFFFYFSFLVVLSLVDHLIYHQRWFHRCIFTEYNPENDGPALKLLLLSLHCHLESEIHLDRFASVFFLARHISWFF